MRILEKSLSKIFQCNGFLGPTWRLKGKVRAVENWLSGMRDLKRDSIQNLQMCSTVQYETHQQSDLFDKSHN